MFFKKSLDEKLYKFLLLAKGIIKQKKFYFQNFKQA